MIKLVVSDMDGTLIGHKQGLSKGNLAAIHKLETNHVQFAIASGRDFDGISTILNQYDVHCEAILGNGAQYVDKDGNILMSCYMNKSVIKDVIAILNLRNIPYMIFTAQGFYTGCNPKYVRDTFIERGKIKFHSDQSEFEKGGINENAPCNQLQKIEDFDEFLSRDIDIIKVEAFSLNKNDIIATKELLKDIPTISYLSSFEDNVEVTDQYAQKGLILEKVAQLKGLDKDEIMVLGDGMNDVTLFQCFKYSFATGNAVDGIKNLAYKVVRDCEDDGFKEAIDMMVPEILV